MTSAQTVPGSRKTQATTLISHSINPPVPSGTRFWTKPALDARGAICSSTCDNWKRSAKCVFVVE